MHGVVLAAVEVRHCLLSSQVRIRSRRSWPSSSWTFAFKRARWLLTLSYKQSTPGRHLPPYSRRYIRYDGGHERLLTPIHNHSNPRFTSTTGSVGVIISSLLIDNFGWTRADPICSLLICALIFASTWPLLKSSAWALMQRVPVGFETRLRVVVEKVGHCVWSLSCGDLSSSYPPAIAPLNRRRQAHSQRALVATIG